MKYLVSAVWWKAAGIRAARTAIVVALPYIPASYLGQVPYLTILSAAVLAGILSLLTSLVGLPEVDGKTEPWWFAVMERVIKTVAQAAVTAMGNAVLLQNVHWLNIAQVSLTAGVGSLLLAFLHVLPEADSPLAQATSLAIHPNSAGVETQQSVPFVAALPTEPAAPASEAPAPSSSAAHRLDTVVAEIPSTPDPETKDNPDDPRA